MSEQLISLREASKRVGVSYTHLATFIRKDKRKYQRLGKAFLITEADIDYFKKQFLKTKEKPAAKAPDDPIVTDSLIEVLRAVRRMSRTVDIMNQAVSELLGTTRSVNNMCQTLVSQKPPTKVILRKKPEAEADEAVTES